MGYTTQFKFGAIYGPEEETPAKFFEALHRAGIRYCASAEQFNSADRRKWHDHEGDIMDAMFVSGVLHVELSGEGESVGDKWDKEFKRNRDGSVTCWEYKYTLTRPEKATSCRSAMKARL